MEARPPPPPPYVFLRLLEWAPPPLPSPSGGGGPHHPKRPNPSHATASSPQLPSPANGYISLLSSETCSPRHLIPLPPPTTQAASSSASAFRRTPRARGGAAS
ncbi:hypothetical protein DAI22_11g161350 [Oryza sativa Japonica Group]|nr:hypothetical protein DAI22_11g161350 [Oryza sativa Japonica Group]